MDAPVEIDGFQLCGNRYPRRDSGAKANVRNGSRAVADLNAESGHWPGVWEANVSDIL